MQPHVILNAQSAQESQTIEQWREIPGSDGRYEVSDHGRVRSWYGKGGRRDAPVYNKPYLSNVGYVTYRLNLEYGKPKNYSVHRLVMLAFVGPSELTVNHKNGDKADNRLCNLEYMTHGDNIRHSYAALGRQNARGEHAGAARLTDAQVEWLRRLSQEGRSNRELIEIFNISANHVSMLKHHKVR
jgi:DNA-binding CsgD family transcriptional regulator